MRDTVPSFPFIQAAEAEESPRFSATSATKYNKLYKEKSRLVDRIFALVETEGLEPTTFAM